MVFHQGDLGDTLHMVTKGTFDVRLSMSSGNSAILRLVPTGDHFGELALLGEVGRRSATVSAVTQAETLALHRGDFEVMRERHRGVDQLLIAALAERVHELSEMVLESLHVSVDKRVYRKLVLLDEYRKVQGTEAIRIGQSALADMVGATRPTVNRILRRAEDQDAIELARNSIRVLDRSRIERWGR